jgi:hypothetical protein
MASSNRERWYDKNMYDENMYAENMFDENRCKKGLFRCWFCSPLNWSCPNSSGWFLVALLISLVACWSPHTSRRFLAGRSSTCGRAPRGFGFRMGDAGAEVVCEGHGGENNGGRGRREWECAIMHNMSDGQQQQGWARDESRWWPRRVPTIAERKEAE